MSTTSNDPVITSYAKASARTITAGGVTYAYRELGQKGGIPVISGHGGIFQFHDKFAPVAVGFLDR
jgi:hypothetical protein